MTVASTPEVENHGMIIAAVRDACASRPGASPLLVVIDTGPYARGCKAGRSSSSVCRREVDCGRSS